MELVTWWKDDKTFAEQSILFEYSSLHRSLRSLINLVDKEQIITREDLADLIETFFKTFKLIHYLSTANVNFTLLSHAPTDERIIPALLKKFGLTNPWGTDAEKIAAIDAINASFQQALHEKPLDEWYPRQECYNAFKQSTHLAPYKINMELYPIVFCLWNRRCDALNDFPNGHGHSLAQDEKRVQAKVWNNRIGQPKHPDGVIAIGYYNTQNFTPQDNSEDELSTEEIEEMPSFYLQPRQLIGAMDGASSEELGYETVVNKTMRHSPPLPRFYQNKKKRPLETQEKTERKRAKETKSPVGMYKKL